MRTIVLIVALVVSAGCGEPNRLKPQSEVITRIKGAEKAEWVTAFDDYRGKGLHSLPTGVRWRVLADELDFDENSSRLVRIIGLEGEWKGRIFCIPRSEISAR